MTASRAGIPLVLAVPAYLTGMAVGTLIATAWNSGAHAAPTAAGRAGTDGGRSGAGLDRRRPPADASERRLTVRPARSARTPPGALVQR